MNRRRDSLHCTKVPDFLVWAQTQGYGMTLPKGDFEVFRLENPDKGELLIGHKRFQSDHITTTGRLTALVSRWHKSRQIASALPPVL